MKTGKELMMKILLVDDSEAFKNVLKFNLDKAGYTVVGEAEDGDIGFKKYKKLKPDVVILDINLPTVSGLTCLKAIKKFDNNAKVIMCSSLIGQNSLLNKARKFGASDFLEKPFKDEELISMLKKFEDNISKNHFNQKEAAAYLNVGTNKIKKLLVDGHLKSEKINGRFVISFDELEKIRKEREKVLNLLLKEKDALVDFQKNLIENFIDDKYKIRELTEQQQLKNNEVTKSKDKLIDEISKQSKNHKKSAEKFKKLTDNIINKIDEIKIKL